MEMRSSGLAVMTAMMLFAGALLVAQQRPQEPQQPATPTQMSMTTMMKGCQERHQTMSRSLDEVAKIVAEAKQSNDPAKMRAALDQVQTRVSEMRQHMNGCTGMMNMMPMHGTESQNQK